MLMITLITAKEWVSFEMSYEIIKNGAESYARAEDEHYIYIVSFDQYYKETIIDMRLIHKGSAERVTPTLHHYYKFGRLYERNILFTTLKEDHHE